MSAIAAQRLAREVLHDDVLQSVRKSKRLSGFAPPHRVGFDLRGEGYQLHAFARFANEQSDAGTLTLELLLLDGCKAPSRLGPLRRPDAWRCCVLF